LQDAVSKSKGIAIEPPKFSSLAVKLLEKDGRQWPFPLNSREPVDFVTDLFKEKMIVVVPPQNRETDNPYWKERLFLARKRRLALINLQGTFMREPRGIVYAGAEISDCMKMSLVPRGLCKILLRLVESFNKNLHYSFGDSKGKELPHIVAPAYTFLECMVMTPPGETAFNGRALDESPESIAHCKKTSSYGEWSTTDTYSFLFYSMYIDLPTWQLVGLPASREISAEHLLGSHVPLRKTSYGVDLCWFYSRDS
jgi:Protein of unknown function (DUF1769)